MVSEVYSCQTKFVEKIKTCFLCSITIFLHRTVYEIMDKNLLEPCRPQMAIRRFACWISKTADAYSEYELLISFPQQQWLLECASMLLYTYFASLVTSLIHVDFGKAYRSGTLLFYRITRPFCYVTADKVLILFLVMRSFRSPLPSLARNEICRKVVVSSKEAGII